MRINTLLCITAFSIFLLDSCNSDRDEIPAQACISNAFPVNGALVPENSTITLKWQAFAKAHSYEVYVGAGASEPILVAAEVLRSPYNYTVPSGNDIIYTWYVKPKDANGNDVGCQDNRRTFKTQALPALMAEQKVVNVLVLNYDPFVKFGSDGPGTRMHQFYSWNDPRELAEGYINDVLISSNNQIKYSIAEWRDIDEYPKKIDGFVYTDSTYLFCMFGGNKATLCHGPDEFDYYHMIDEHDIVEGINQDQYEEVWIFGAPYFGFWEAAMAGLNPFYINGGMYNQSPTKKEFAIMGFSYERGVAEMMHDLCHRTEATMSKVYGGWSAEQLTTSWAKFAANKTQSGVAAVGSCHYPPNALKDYDYGNQTFVSSSASDWLNYPLLTGAESQVNAESWGGPDYHRNYLIWWFSHLPNREGVDQDGKLNCWWKYIFEFNETVPH